MRRTKIVATIGPVTSSDTAIHDLVAAGVDIFRLNFSHGTHDVHTDLFNRIRAEADRQGRVVAMLQDLSGPKIRTGLLPGGVPIELHPGDPLQIVIGDGIGGPGHVSTTYAEIANAVHRGDTLLLDDGRIQLRVESTSPGHIETVVVHGGLLGEHKGINLPGVVLPSSGLTAKDAEDLALGVRLGVDFIALSFVQRAADVRSARDRLRELGATHIRLVAKLERPEAVSNLEEILAETDAVMVARGDLGLELPMEHVPRVQKEITRRALALGIPVIVATQVLESMRTEPRPTRAEVSDAAHAVESGVDAIMLAGETAAGQYPIKAVQMLDAIIRDAEEGPPGHTVALEGSQALGGHGRAICEAAVTLVSRGDATAIVAITRGGKTARLLSALRPRVPIFGATDQPQVARRLALSWGVVPVMADLEGVVGEAANRVGQELVEKGAIPPASAIVIVSITPDLSRGPSNVLKIQRV
ncbi:MAG: pyruvate kinase [Acidobacteria bacterium]|nr:pyruvate kinase [Acidobacteriota bacterium]